ncbi:hypothetical protein CgunFtcFv8_018840 [Champsocephalus gunnari]|uniref:Uncharacterized protein n=1 Tax=Champsocephalus gunnari TaxID=52237 RepID=A0AAN8GXH3_CHAGU|nr:hypothetical protein CgunFtcFv8_018840 [Champsocephalus gunnari]
MGKTQSLAPSIALVPPHFTRTPTLCVPLVTDPCNPPPKPLHSPQAFEPLTGLQMYVSLPHPQTTPLFLPGPFGPPHSYGLYGYLTCPGMGKRGGAEAVPGHPRILAPAKNRPKD